MPNGFVYNFVLQIFIFKFSFPVGNVQSFNLLFNLLFLAVFHPFLFFPPIQYFSLNPISWHPQNIQNIHRILCPLMTPLYSSPLYISHISSVVSISFCLNSQVLLSNVTLGRPLLLYGIWTVLWMIIIIRTTVLSTRFGWVDISFKLFATY